ncbi:3-hydroxyacyl-CoA dehydrogenase family protein [Gordonia polyisoprenivorans]|uniref:3-hydroxyacyl-CoA dehydrogenase family protein n=1 Tax=Gordonia polyisoprenivorans TaxID=84595 RepID=UPI001AD73EEE|nr:3-hydroxyacyl-CoA dehydrogenase family protein [Gordonia polyisoprenivorans]QTI68653.1 3-hydroxyacyl-CoA dehydrogenase family protein [Gordonia polyisoprenivorans]
MNSSTSGGDLPATVGVVGGGRMGAGIAQVFAERGVTVTIADSLDQEGARSRVATGLQRAADRDLLGGRTPDEVLARVHTVGEPRALPTDLGLVVEAVPENVALKLDVLAQVAETVAATTVIASNTSSLSISELGAALPDPSRFVGMHFFNPVPVSELVEIVRAGTTAQSTVDAVRGWVDALGKTAIVVNDSPGFATSRLGVHLGLEAIRMVEEGVADAESIDRAMELGYRHPMGPLRSTDLVGLDVRLAVADHLAATLGARFEPPQLLRDKVTRGELGRKSGRGFYDWEG